jgi:hypothetical protein
MSSTPTTDPSNLSSILSISSSDDDAYSTTGSDDEIVWSLSELSSQSHSMSASLSLSSASDLSPTESSESVRPASDVSDEDYVVLTRVRARSRSRSRRSPGPDRPVDALANDFRAFSIGGSTSMAPNAAAKDWTAAGAYAPKFVKAKEPQSYPSLASWSSCTMLDPQVARIAQHLGILRLDSTKAEPETKAENRAARKAAFLARNVAKAKEAAATAAGEAVGSPTACTADVASRVKEYPSPTPSPAPAGLARSPSVATVKPAASTMTATAKAETKAQRRARRRAAHQQNKARKAAKKKVAAAGKPTSGTTVMVSALTPTYTDAVTFISKYVPRFFHIESILMHLPL